MEKRILLSICIPTYNRGYILKEILDKYVKNKEFDDEVEIIISDNCSSDDTETICRKYSKQHLNIHYYRNNENVNDANFYIVLDHGKGYYLKLLNDWSYYDEGSLRYVKEVIRENVDNQESIFFTDKLLFTKRGKGEVIYCNTLDEYVQTVSTFVTSNNVFGVWRKQWEKIEERGKYTNLKLQQEDWSYQLAVNGSIIYNKKLLKVSKIKRKLLGGYNWFDIHLDNYYKIMMPYVNRGLICDKTLMKDKHYLLEHFKAEMCYTYFYNFTKRWRFETKGTSKLIRKYYSGDPYLLYYFLKLPLYYPYLFVKYLVKSLLGIGV